MLVVVRDADTMAGWEKIVVVSEKEEKELLYYYDGIFPRINAFGKEIANWNLVHFAKANKNAIKKIEQLVYEILRIAWTHGELVSKMYFSQGAYSKYIINDKAAIQRIIQLIEQISELLP